MVVLWVNDSEELLGGTLSGAAVLVCFCCLFKAFMSDEPSLYLLL